MKRKRTANLRAEKCILVKASVEKFTLLKSGDETVCLDAHAARAPCEIAGEVRGEIYGGRGLRIQTNLWRGEKERKNKR